MPNDHKMREWVLVSFAILIAILTVYSFFANISFFIDALSGFFCIALLYWVHRNYKVSATALYLVCVAMLIHLIGVLGAYPHFIIKDVVGYDKLVHIFSCFAISYLVIQMSTERHLRHRYFFAVMIVLGMASLVEVNEFIGSVYFEVENGGIFSIEDGLPPSSDLQKYDTYFDMIFNITGALLGVAFTIAKSHFLKLKKKSKKL